MLRKEELNHFFLTVSWGIERLKTFFLRKVNSYLKKTDDIKSSTPSKN